MKKVSAVNRAALGLGGGNIWRAVNVAKNQNHDSIPTNLTLNGLPVLPSAAADAFAKFFKEKITSHVNNTVVSQTVYNGKNKLIVQNRNFMTKNDVGECIRSLQSKSCEGFDRIPVCVIADAHEILLDPMSYLDSNYRTRCKLLIRV